MTNTCFSIGVDYLIVRRYLLVFFGIAAMAASALPISGTTQGTTTSAGQFVKRVVTNGLASPFQVLWGPDGYLWVTERTAGRVIRIHPSDGSTTTAIVIGEVGAGGPGGLLGMTLDPGL